MTEFCSTTGVSHHLEQIIKNADDKLIIVSPYLQINERLKDLIQDKDRMKIDIRVIYGKNDLKPEENNWLKSLNSIRTNFCKNLHAKCYLNDKEALITSMNMYRYSEVHNNEMGIYVSKDSDPKLYSDIYDEAKRLIRYSEEDINSNDKSTSDVFKKQSNTKNNSNKSDNGYCIRCGDSISLNPMYPYCKKCFSTWKKKGDENIEESACHICGKSNKSNISKAKPTCYNCYKKYKDTYEFPLG
ncbi:hypothetical protein Metev_0467 [Methanohalobium evestigatum Z-7303]|uniref:Phospholipase D-like domain-containing protein n=1 Tax=Methanohalobium evestigatum (strain ATCC BAA-1072 / DSM 3721 / NBRC 107634 / OCM 161 / Z-7303) TaxID=644295 RepID=D7E840_METEZ|nr:phospholipase D family protein [Methanohalobium evestigatum]ADI73382.1 hypothetical protein Metev_0467 [Methanohalobium evestigatum Z-7303]